MAEGQQRAGEDFFSRVIGKTAEQQQAEGLKDIWKRCSLIANVKSRKGLIQLASFMSTVTTSELDETIQKFYAAARSFTSDAGGDDSAKLAEAMKLAVSFFVEGKFEVQPTLQRFRDITGSDSAQLRLTKDQESIADKEDLRDPLPELRGGYPNREKFKDKYLQPLVSFEVVPFLATRETCAKRTEAKA